MVGHILMYNNLLHILRLAFILHENVNCNSLLPLLRESRY